MTEHGIYTFMDCPDYEEKDLYDTGKIYDVCKDRTYPGCVYTCGYVCLMKNCKRGYAR